MNKGTKLTPQLREAIAADYRNQMTGLDIAKKYNLPKTTIYRALEKQQIVPERKDELFSKKVIDDDTKNLVAEKYTKGFSNKDICDEFDITSHVLNTILFEKGLIVKQAIIPKDTRVVKVGNSTRTILCEGDQLAICDRYKDGPETQQELADAFNVHIDTIRSTLRRHNVVAKKWIPEEIVDQFCHDFQEGTHTLGELTRIYHLSPDNIRYWLVKRGLMVTPAVSYSLQDVERLQTLSPTEIKKKFKSLSPEMIDILTDMVRDPSIPPHTRSIIAIQIIDHAYGKPKEEPEEFTDTKSTTAKVLELVSNSSNIFTKK